MIENDDYIFFSDKDFWYARNEKNFSIHLDFHDRISLSQFYQVLNDRDNIIACFKKEKDYYSFHLQSADGHIYFADIDSEYIEDVKIKLNKIDKFYIITTFSETTKNTQYLEDLVLSLTSIIIDDEKYFCKSNNYPSKSI